MAPRRETATAAAAAAISTSEDEDAASSQQQQPSGSESGSGSESESEAESQDQTQKSPEIPKTPAVPQPTSSEESASGSGSESESESEPEPPKVDTTTVKPLASKPMDSPSTKKPRSKPAAAVAGTKRAVENEVKESKRVKKNDSTSIPVEDSNGAKKQMFQRLWSEEDEIAILKGMMEYTAKKGSDPFGDMVDFHNFIKKSVHVDVNKNQLLAKARRLKKKYENNATKEKEGKARAFSKSHEQKMYDLSKKLWGGEKVSKGNEKEIAEMKNQFQKQRGSKAAAVGASPKADKEKVSVASPVLKKHKEVAMEEDENDGEIPVLVKNDVSIGMSTFEEEVINNGVGLLTEAKRKVLEEKRKDLEMLTAELYLKRVDYAREKAKMVVDAMRSARK